MKTIEILLKGYQSNQPNIFCTFINSNKANLPTVIFLPGGPGGTSQVYKKHISALEIF